MVPLYLIYSVLFVEWLLSFNSLCLQVQKRCLFSVALFDYLLKSYCIPLSLRFFLVVVTVHTGLVPCCVPWCPHLHCPSSLCVPLSSLSLHPYAKLTFASIQLCLSVLLSNCCSLCLLFCLLPQPDNVYSNNLFVPFTF